MRRNKRGYGAPQSAAKNISTSSSTEGRRVRTDTIRQSFSSKTAAQGTVSSACPMLLHLLLVV
jgi:hypothetical protein